MSNTQFAIGRGVRLATRADAQDRAPHYADDSAAAFPSSPDLRVAIIAACIETGDVNEFRELKAMDAIGQFARALPRVTYSPAMIRKLMGGR